jgi:hypothetical protein
VLEGGVVGKPHGLQRERLVRRAEVDELDLEVCTRLGAVIAERAALNQGFPSPPAPTRDVA